MTGRYSGVLDASFVERYVLIEFPRVRREKDTIKAAFGPNYDRLVDVVALGRPVINVADILLGERRAPTQSDHSSRGFIRKP